MRQKMDAIDRVIDDVNRSRLRWVILQFTDLSGMLRQVSVSAKLLDRDSFLSGFGKLDGSSVEGFKSIEESDLVLKPVPETYTRDPFTEESARMLSIIYDSFGEKRLERDPRLVAEKTESFLARHTYEALVSAEMEFHVFDKVESWLSSLKSGYTIYSEESGIEMKVNHGLYAKNGYYPISPMDSLLNLRGEIAALLEDIFGIRIECHHHEVGASGQGELNFRASSPVKASDTIQMIKYVSKNVAAKHGKILTFMPKPIYGDNGSGMHVHASIWRDGENLFYDPDDDYAGISQIARYFIGGLLDHARALSAIVSPTVNSYKRLVPGYEAPIYLAWSRGNRSAAVRVPIYHSSSKKSARIEYRPPDPTANPYLLMSAIIMAGMDGIIKKKDPGDPIDKNIYHLTLEQRRELNIGELPATLLEALSELESDNEFLRPVFTTEIIEAYIEMKKKEWSLVESRISPAEIYYYINF